MADTSSDQSGSGNSRWWESYLVRYFSGFLVGAICVSAFVAHLAFLTAGAGQIETVVAMLLGKDAPTIAILVTIGLLGLVYSYLVSAPITVIHFGRGVRIFWDAQSRYFWFAWVVILCFSAIGVIETLVKAPAFVSVILVPALLYFLHFYFGKKSPGNQAVGRGITTHSLLEMAVFISVWVFIAVLVLSFIVDLTPEMSKWQLNLLTFSLPAIWVGISQYITLFKVLLAEGEVHQFYQRLTKARSNGSSKEIRESYTHLREHSNSTFIVILELCFFCLISLVVSMNVKSKQTLASFLDANGDGVRLGTWLFCIFMIWSIPNLFLWSRANSLERDFANASHKYLRRRK